MASPLSPRVAIVTGAASGIGLSIAQRLAGDGLAIVLNDIPSKAADLSTIAQEIEADGGVAPLCYPGDVTVEANVRDMIEAAVEKWGKIDVMVANAGVAASQSLIEANIEEWERLWAVNIRGVVLCYKYAAIQMVKQGFGGRIIGASSVCGKKGFANNGAYCISKFAVRGLTQSAALELSDHNITVNAYAPGLINTPMNAAFGGTGETLKRLLRIPDGKFSGPEVIASLVSYIASLESHFITGQTISVDGGIVFD